MSLADFPYGPNVGQVKKVKFGILSPQRIKQKAVCEIYKHITSSSDREGTVMDPRLGPIERGIVCPTCKYTYKDCPGHYGYLNLAKPVYHPQYYQTILTLLGCFCHRCSSILIDKNETLVKDEIYSKTGKNRLAFVKEKTKTVKKCFNCGAEKPIKYVKDKDGIMRIKYLRFKGEYRVKTPGGDTSKFYVNLNPEIVYNIFKNISDEDVELIGLDPYLSRPEWMLWTIMLVPPPAMRPSVRAESGKYSDDDLTYKLNEIIKFNNLLRQKISSNSKPSLIEDCWQLLQYHVATYIDNEISNIPKAQQRSGRPLKTIRQRIKTKEGRIRGNLMGKRVNGSARTVITAEPSLSMDQLGIPIRVAMNLTYPELVTVYNRQKMLQLIQNGSDIYPGAKHIKFRNSKGLTRIRGPSKHNLEPGDIVYRHLMDNDWVLFNRQPSLHKMSMMAHRIKVLTGNTFRLNVNVCAPYNADYDGDEMNIFVPMTLESVIELRFLASVPTQIVSPQASKPVMGLVQDSLLGIYLLSQEKRLNITDMMQLIHVVSGYNHQLPSLRPGINPEHPLWSGHQLLSLVLPEISVKKEPKGIPTAGSKQQDPFNVTDEEKAGKIEILSGQINAGILDKTIVEKKSDSLFHMTWNDYGPLVTRDLFDSLSFIANKYLQIVGFSCGIRDCVIQPEQLDIIKQMIRETKSEVSQMIERAKLGIGLPKGETPFSYKLAFPKKIIEIMGKCRGNVENQVAKSINQTNFIDIMVRCGSKGNKNNLSQIIGMLGQQEIEASWIENQFYRRTLPHFHKDDLRPDAHGFIGHSFMSGLSPTEYWFHAQEGRMGIITKAIKTAETGYIQRKLIKALEDLRICYDGTVRNANNMIIQVVYGNDGFDASYLENQNIFFLNYTMDKFRLEFKYDNLNQLQYRLTPNAYEELTSIANYQNRLEQEYQTIFDYYKYLKEMVPFSYLQHGAKMPINFKRLLTTVQVQYQLDQMKIADINPIYIIDRVSELREKIVVDSHHKSNEISTKLLNALISTYLSSKVLIYKYKLNRPAFDFIIEKIYLLFLRAIVNPGDNVGIIAAQSLGEPTTQMALNTFHYTGQGSKANISRGTPRLRELMSLTKNPKTPSMTIHFDQSYFEQNLEAFSNANSININRIEKIGAEIEYTILRDLVIRTEIYYDPDDRHTCVTEDQDFIDSYYALLPVTDLNYQPLRQNFLLRIEFDREIIMRKHIQMYLIQDHLDNFLTHLQIPHNIILSDINANKLICRIKIDPKNPEYDLSDPIGIIKHLEENILSLRIKGIPHVEQCLINTQKKNIVLPTGQILTPFDSDQTSYETASKQYNNRDYIIETNGTNLIEVLCLPNVDTYRTVSNDVWEIYKIYGIEAARKCIITEIVQLLEFNETYIQERHISLLVDVMTNQGTLVSVDRHGVNKSESGPWHRASFEETTTQLINASIFNEEDIMTGVSANIMFGQFIPSGTNAFRIVLDVDKVKSQVTVEPEKDKPKTTAQHEAEPLEITDLCADERFEFRFKINPINEPKKV